MGLDDFTNGNVEPSSGPDTERKFQPFTKEEFEEALEDAPMDFEAVDDIRSKEYVYEARSSNGTFTLRIWSTVDTRTDKAREKGDDAIRIVLLHSETSKPVLSETKTLRIKTWRKNLIKKIRSMRNRKDEIQMCDECGGVMVIRTNKESGDQFYGCTNYPGCRNTEPKE